MIIDAHVHIGKTSTFLQLSEGSPEELVARMDALGIKQALVCGHVVAIEGDFRIGNELLREAVSRYPGRFIPAFVANPRFEREACGEVDRCAGEWGWRVLKLHPEAHATPADHPLMRRVVRHATIHGCLVVSHSGDEFVGPRSTPDRLAKLAEAFPETMFIWAHMGVTAWRDAVEQAKHHPNVVLDTSGSCFDHGMIEEAVEAIGSDRIVYGSDATYFSMAMGLSKVQGADLRPTDRAAILGANIARILAAVGAVARQS